MALVELVSADGSSASGMVSMLLVCTSHMQVM